jgi:hypothetical protein
MRFYIGSSFKNIHNVRKVADQLIAQGFTPTYDWTTNTNVDSLLKLKEIGQQERVAVLAADLVIIMMPAGKGSHVEFGIALGAGKKIVLYSPTDEIDNFKGTTTFYHLHEVQKCIGSLSELVATVSSFLN